MAPGVNASGRRNESEVERDWTCNVRYNLGMFQMPNRLQCVQFASSYIVGPDVEHYLSLGKYKALYPTAKVIGVEDHRSKPPLKDVEFAGTYGGKEDVKYGFEDEIDAWWVHTR